MNEEIQFGLGLDTGAFFTGIRKVKSEVQSLKEGGAALGDVLKGAFAGLTLAAVVSSAKSLLEFAQHISDTAENIGTSTKFLQEFNYAANKTGVDSETAEKSLSKLAVKIGEARSGSLEAAASFDKWGVSLKNADGSASSLEQVTMAAKERLKDISDPAQRAALAFDLLGKSGVKLLQTLNEFDALQKHADDGRILNDSDIARLDSAQKKIEGMGGALKVFGGKLLGAGLTMFGIADPNAGVNAAIKKYENKGTPEQIIDPKHVKALAEALRALRDAQSHFGGENNETKLVDLMRQEAQIADDLKDKSLDDIERIKLQTKLAEKHNQVLDQRKVIADEFNKKEKEAADKKKADLERQRTMQNELDHASLASAKADDALADAKNKRSQLSIEDLTSSKFRFGGELGDDQQKAFQIKELERQAEWNRVRGLTDESKERLSRADALRSSLSSNVPESERFPFKSLQESQAEATKHLAELVAKAKGDGLIVSVSQLPP